MGGHGTLRKDLRGIFQIHCDLFRKFVCSKDRQKEKRRKVFCKQICVTYVILLLSAVHQKGIYDIYSFI